MTSKSSSTGLGRSATSWRTSRCMSDRTGAVDRVQQRKFGHRSGGQRQFLLRAKVDDDLEEDNEGNGQHDAKAQQINNPKGQHCDLTYYSAYTHSASPTYFKWVNLTAKEIHQSLIHRPGYMHSWLTTARGYDRNQPQLLFYLNHPVQFVQVVGVVVSTEEWFERFWLFTIDDSSGYTIDVVCQKPNLNKKTELRASVSEDREEKEIEQETIRLSEQVQRDVHIGSVLQIKGTVTLFQRRTTLKTVYADSSTGDQDVTEKGTDASRQISLQRLNLIHDTNTEIALIAARTKFYVDVLSKPWRLSKKEQEKLYGKASGESEGARRRVKRHVERLKQRTESEAADASKIQADYEADENERAVSAEKAKEAGKRLLQIHEVRAGPDPSPVNSVPNVVPAVSTERQTSQATGSNHKRKRRSKVPTSTTKEEQHKGVLSDTTMSFGIDEDEKSALLRAAFGI